MITVNERTAQTVEFDLLDQTGAVVPSSSLTTFVLTLYNRPKYGGATTVINSRDHQNVLNTNDVTISSQGHVTWNYRRLDGTIIDDTQTEEVHVALFEASWNGGAGGLTYEVEFLVKNLLQTP